MISQPYLSTQQVNTYWTEGYLHLRGVYTVEEIQRARDLIEEDIAQGGWASAPVHNEGITTDIFERMPELANIVFNDNYLQAIKDLFAPDPILLAEPAVHRSRYYYWHKDSTFLDEQGESFHWQTDFQAAMTVMYLQANHPDYGGGITVVPGTHKNPDFYHTIPKMNLIQRGILKAKKILKRSHFDLLDQHPQLLSIPTEVGDVLILDMRLDHKGTPAKKPAPATKYGIMNIACSGEKTAEALRNALRKRPSKYYAEYLAKEPKTTPVLQKIEAKKGIKMWL